MELYIHIPFCIRKCAYCDFLSFSSSGKDRGLYTDALLAEIRAQEGLFKETVRTVFIGGGTPSLLAGSQIAAIMNALRASFAISPDTEITIEANPGTVSAENLAAYRAAGINRVSFGCQSASDEELALLGRVHCFRDFTESYQMAREAGFENINVDLMFGIPAQTLQSWEDSLRRVAELGPEHISAYSLILEEDDSWDSWNVPIEEEERDMFDLTPAILADYGLAQYEISNYAKPGFACAHNIGYWTGVPYLGLGLGASSYLEDPDRGCFARLCNTEDFSAYLRDSGEPRKIRRITELLDADERQAEFMILGLRMTEGVSEEDFAARFGKRIEEVYGDVIEKHRGNGLLVQNEGRWRLTRRGRSLANVVMREFL